MDKINTQIKQLLHPLTIFSVIALILLCFNFVDFPLERSLHDLHFRDGSIVLRKLTHLGNGFIIIPFILIGLWSRFWQTNRNIEEHMWFVCACVAFTSVVCWILKFSFGRARPDMWHNYQEYGFYWLQIKSLYWSFPSGHTTTVFSVVFALAYLYPSSKLAIQLGGLIVALTRVALGYHYLSDVIGGIYFTSLEMLIVIYSYEKYKNNKEQIYEYG